MSDEGLRAALVATDDGAALPVRRDGEGALAAAPSSATSEKTFMDNRPAVGAPKNSRWGYLPCGCCNDGHGRHIYGGAS